VELGKRTGGPVNNLDRPASPGTNNDVPEIYSVSPSSGPATITGSVTINGYGFRSGAQVKFGTDDATGETLVSSTRITCTAPVHAAGLVNVKVVNSDTTECTKTNAYTYIAGPAVTSCSPNSGVAEGGDAVTITGTGFVDGATVTFEGVSATDVVFVSSTSITCVTPAGDGLATVRVTNPDTQYGESDAFTYPSSFDPSDLSLTGWWRNWTSGNWVGTASAGTSGSHNLTVGNPPGTSTLNSLSVADFDGVNDNFSGAAFSNYFTGSAFSYGFLLNCDSDVASAANIWDDAAVFTSSNGNYGLHTRNNSGTHQIRAYNDGSNNHVENIANWALGSWKFVQVKYDGSKIYSRINSASWSAGTTSSGIGTSETLVMGISYSNVARFDGKIAEIFFADSVLSDADFDNLKGYLNSRYALSL
jgi:hypothetical protein